MSKITKESLLNYFSAIDDEYILEAEYNEEEQARLQVAARAASAIAKEAREATEEKRAVETADEKHIVDDEELPTKPEALPNRTTARVIYIAFGTALAAAAILIFLFLWNPDRSDVASTTSTAEETTAESTPAATEETVGCRPAPEVPTAAMISAQEITEVETITEEPTTEAAIDMSGLADVTIDEEHFPDALFREFISAHFDSNSDGKLEPLELVAVKEIRLLDEDDSSIQVVDVSGTEYFPLLEVLECPSFELAHLDISKNTALVELDCNGEKLTELDISQNTALKKLCISGIRITALETLDISGTEVSEIDLSRNTALKRLDVSYTHILELDLTNNPNLEEFIAIGTKMPEIDLSGNPKLKTIVFSLSNLKQLDISNNPDLEEVIVTPTMTVTGAEGRESIINRYDPTAPLT